MQKLIYLIAVYLFLGAAWHAPPVRKGQDHALFFAVDNYRHNNLTNLKNPVKNATDIAGVLHRRFGFDTLVMRNPTMDQVEQKLNEYRDKFARNLDGRYPANGQLLIYFSGHGVEFVENGYFLPADADPARPNRTGLDYIYLRNFINQIRCDHILVGVDACYSVYFDPIKGRRASTEYKRPGELTEAEKTLLNHREHKARLFFTSDAVGDMTPDRSNFARKMLEGLDAFKSPTGYMTSSELFANFVQKASPAPRGGDFGDDDPRSAFLFFFEGGTRPTVDPVQDREAWEDAKEANTLSAYRAYRSRFPGGEFRSLADRRITNLEDHEAWQTAKTQGTKTAYEKYLSANPSGAYRELAEEALRDARPAITAAPNNMVFVEGGTFTMGCTSEQGSDCYDDEKPAHQVTVKSFYIGKYEVTNREFCEFLNAKGNQTEGGRTWLDLGFGVEKSGNRFVPISGKENHPVNCVTWYGARAYCAWMSEKTGKTYRLPTEAEWEYAARGGRSSQKYKYAGSNNIDEVAWYDSNSGGSTKPVGQKKANELGIYDMSGNVWEWVQDCWHDSYQNAPANGSAWLEANSGDCSGRVLRGGSWSYIDRICRLSGRIEDGTEGWGNDYGFRLAQD